MINIVLLAERSFVREAISQMLQSEGDFEIIGTAGSYSEIIELGAQGNIDVLIIDQNVLERPDFQDAITLNQTAGTRIIIVADDTKTVLKKYFNTGIHGFVSKAADPAELAFAIRHIAGGNRYVCTSLVTPFLNDYLHQSTDLEPFEPTAITPREKEILALIADGFTNQEIADKLFSSKRTVEGHRQSLISKTGSRNTAALIRFALNHRLISDSLN